MCSSDSVFITDAQYSFSPANTILVTNNYLRLMGDIDKMIDVM